MKNFAYGYTDREIGPGRPTPARPIPPLLYHKPQALSIGILHKKNSGRFFCPKILIIICVIIIFIPHRCKIIAIVEWVFQRIHTRLRIVCVVRTIPTIYRAMIMFHSSSSFGSSSYSQGTGQSGSAYHLSLSVIIRYYIFGIKSIGKMHKHFAQKLLNLPIDTKFRPWRQYTADQLYHTFSRLSIGKM